MILTADCLFQLRVLPLRPARRLLRPRPQLPASPCRSSRQPLAANLTTAPATPSAAQSQSDLRNIVRRKLTGYVGFANLPNQWHRKSVRKGFNFNVMVVGKSKLPPISAAIVR